LKCISEMNSVILINIASTKVTNEGLSVLAKMNGHLIILRMPLVQLNVTGAKSLSRLQSLNDLDIRHSNINDAVMQYIPMISSLNTLNISANPLTDKGLLCLKKSHLHKLLIYDCPNVTPAAVAELKKAIPGLEIDSKRDLQISF
ncbi:MAG: hypothetical protein ACRD3W_31105, partial [Terriglobales bacterium]